MCLENKIVKNIITAFQYSALIITGLLQTIFVVALFILPFAGVACVAKGYTLAGALCLLALLGAIARAAYRPIA